MLLSSCLITKNEESQIAGCLESLRGLVDEMVVLDTGSTDRTVSIAQECGASVHEAPWHGFAEARDRALELCSGEWIFQADADEQVDSAAFEEIRQILTSSKHIAYRVQLFMRSRLTPYWRLRVFRNDPRLRFEGVIHEIIDYSVLRVVEADGETIGNLPLTLRHLGGDDPHGRAETYLPYLLETKRRSPKHAFNLTHLAGALTKLQRYEEAEATWHEAVEAARRRESLYERYDSMAFIGAIEWRLTCGHDTTAWTEEAVELFPCNMHLQWFLGRLRMRQERYREAIPIFETILKQGGKPEVVTSFGYDERLFGEATYESIANCHFHLEQYEEARRYFELAGKAAPGTSNHAAKAALCAHLEQKQGL